MTDEVKYPYVIDLASIDHDKLDGVALAADGCTGIIARAEMGTINDPDFAKHKAAADAGGLAWGGYFGPRWDLDIVPQMRAFLTALGKRTSGMITPWIDVEEGPRNFDGQTPRVVIGKWMTAIDMMIAWGGDAGSYTSARVIHEGLKDLDLSLLAPKSKLWLAQYGSYYKPPTIPNAWANYGWALHQFAGDSPKVPGVVGKVDLSRFNPALGDMKAYFDAGAKLS
jgi:GH25 family lysozyme M1 (1,4-beta-N-acetylmuramidase)